MFRVARRDAHDVWPASCLATQDNTYGVVRSLCSRACPIREVCLGMTDSPAGGAAGHFLHIFTKGNPWRDVASVVTLQLHTRWTQVLPGIEWAIRTHDQPHRALYKHNVPRAQ